MFHSGKEVKRPFTFFGLLAFQFHLSALFISTSEKKVSSLFCEVKHSFKFHHALAR